MECARIEIPNSDVNLTGIVIGPGGSNIRDIEARSNCRVNV